MVKADVGDDGGITLDKTFYVEFPEGYRCHQIRLEGGDCSTGLFLLSVRVSVPTTQWMPTVLWLTVIVSGVYHGVNPGMGWPLAVSAGLMGKGRRDLIASLGPLGAGHFLAMAGILAPFASDDCPGRMAARKSAAAPGCWSR